eukprot:6009795-Ditylum_brightwellii.AAC.1
MKTRITASKSRVSLLTDQLSKAYRLYDDLGHFKNLPDKALDMKLPLRSIPTVDGHICGGVSRGLLKGSAPQETAE